MDTEQKKYDLVFMDIEEQNKILSNTRHDIWTEVIQNNSGTEIAELAKKERGY